MPLNVLVGKNNSRVGLLLPCPLPGLPRAIWVVTVGNRTLDVLFDADEDLVIEISVWHYCAKRSCCD